MAAVVPEEFEGGAGAFEEVGNLLGLLGGNEGIEATRADEDGLCAQIGQGLRLEGEHGMQEVLPAGFADAEHDQRRHQAGAEAIDHLARRPGGEPVDDHHPASRRVPGPPGPL